jgi:NAD(P)H-hydrate repair Nnr-like enzyme with NAD(P)H-hydrate dehydratase domain
MVDDIGIPASVLDTVRPLTFHSRPALWSVALLRSDGANAGHRQASPGVVVTDQASFEQRFPGLAGSKLERAREAVALAGAVIAMLGADPVVASPDGRAAIAGNGMPEMEAAGDCEAVAGAVGELRARGLPAFEAAAAAAWALGEARGRRDATALLDIVHRSV